MWRVNTKKTGKLCKSHELQYALTQKYPESFYKENDSINKWAEHNPSNAGPIVIGVQIRD